MLTDHVRHDPQDEVAARFYSKIDRSRAVQQTGEGPWLVLGHPEAVQLLRDRTVSSMTRNPGLGVWDQVSSRFFMFKDGRQHLRLRRMVGDCFTPARLAELKSVIHQATCERLDRLSELAEAGERQTDIMTTVAYPVAADAICHLLGVSPVEGAFLGEWAVSLSRHTTDEQFNRSAEQILAFFREQLTAYRETPRMSGLLPIMAERAHAAGMEDDELLATCILLVVAGFETSANFFGNMLLSLLWRRERFERLLADEALVAPAIEELLRLHTPAHVVMRRTTEATVVGDTVIPADAQVAVLLGLCNRDPRVFDDPDAYRLDRASNPHLSFSQGPHYCVGASLARVELEAMLRAVLDRLPLLSLLAEQPLRWSGRFLGRGLDQLRVLAS
ncbi:cytochrome P450 [Streptomyces sp. NPDC127114]|uniref:cytochrome P450 n=1 Tax=Streptomyces sp. NPDC127114 TaxID=3345366 RepID=UPI00363AF858